MTYPPSWRFLKKFCSNKFGKAVLRHLGIYDVLCDAEVAYSAARSDQERHEVKKEFGKELLVAPFVKVGAEIACATIASGFLYLDFQFMLMSLAFALWIHYLLFHHH